MIERLPGEVSTQTHTTVSPIRMYCIVGNFWKYINLLIATSVENITAPQYNYHISLFIGLHMLNVFDGIFPWQELPAIRYLSRPPPPPPPPQALETLNALAAHLTPDSKDSFMGCVSSRIALGRYE